MEARHGSARPTCAFAIRNLVRGPLTTADVRKSVWCIHTYVGYSIMGSTVFQVTVLHDRSRSLKGMLDGARCDALLHTMPYTVPSERYAVLRTPNTSAVRAKYP
jgi:hypothetical protein